MRSKFMAGFPAVVLLFFISMPSPVLFAQEDDAFDADAFFGQEAEIVSEEAVPEDDVLVPAPTLRTDASLEFSGEADTTIVYSILNPFDGSGASWENGTATSFGTLRLDVTGGNREYVKVEASLITLLGYGALTAETTDLAVSLKKLYLSVYTDLVDISVGRMIVNYGRGTVFSPVDLFSTTDTTDLALDRTGTDAVRVLFPFGVVSGLDLVSSLEADMADSTFGGRFYSNLSGWDFGVSGFRRARSASVGGSSSSTAVTESLAFALDLKGDLELGISAELVGHIPLDPDGVGESLAFQTMLGCDYSLGNEWFFDLEYLWNYTNGDEAGDMLNGAFLGDHTGFASVTWKPDEFSALDLRCIANVTSLDWQLSGAASRSIVQGATLTAFVLWRSGNVEGEIRGNPFAAADPSRASAGFRLSVSF